MSGGVGPDWDAAAYDVLADPHVAWGARVVGRVACARDATILDAGCGTGRVSQLLLPLIPEGHLIACDRSPAMLAVAREALLPSRGPELTFLRRDLLDLTPADLAAPVDVVFSTATFHWIGDHARLFRRLHEVLRPGGSLVAQCGGGPNLRRETERAARMMAEPPFADHVAGWTPPKFYADVASTRERLAQAGFVDVDVWLEHAPIVLPSAERHAHYLATIVFREHVARLPSADLRAAFIDRLTKAAATDDPPYGLDYWRLNIGAVRPS